MYKVKIGNVPGVYRNKIMLEQISFEEDRKKAQRKELFGSYLLNSDGPPEPLSFVLMNVKMREYYCYNDEVNKTYPIFSATRVENTDADKYCFANKYMQKHFFNSANITRLKGKEEATICGVSTALPNGNLFPQVSTRIINGQLPLSTVLTGSKFIGPDDWIELSLLEFPKKSIRCVANRQPTIFDSYETLVTQHNENVHDEDNNPVILLPIEFNSVCVTINPDGAISAKPVVVQTILNLGSYDYYRREFSQDFAPNGKEAYSYSLKNYEPQVNWSCKLDENFRDLNEVERGNIGNTVFSKIMLTSEFSKIKEFAVLEKAQKKLEDHNSTNNLEEMKEEIFRIESTISRYEEQNKESACRISEWEEKIDLSAEKIAELSVEPEQHENNIAEINNDIDIYISDISYYKDRIKSREQRIELYVCEIADLQKKINDYDDSKVQKLEKRIKLLLTKVKKKSTEILESSSNVNWTDNYRRSNFVLESIAFISDHEVIVANEENIDELLLDKSCKIHSMKLYNDTHLEIKLNARDAMERGNEPETRIAGPLAYHLSFSSNGYPKLFISAKNNSCIVGQLEGYSCLHPHTRSEMLDTYLSGYNANVCLGEAEGGLLQAWSDKDIDLAIQFVIGWATNADTEDSWGMKGKEYFPAPSDLNPMSKEEYARTLRSQSPLGIVSVEYKSKSNTLRYDITEKGWTYSKNKMTYLVQANDPSKFVKVKLDKLNKSSVYTETNRT